MPGCMNYKLESRLLGEIPTTSDMQKKKKKYLLAVPWTAKRTNQAIVKEVNPEYSLEGLLLKLNFQYFGYLMQRANSSEKTLMVGKTEGRRRRGQQRMRWSDAITDSMDEFEQALGNAAVQGVTKSWT